MIIGQYESVESGIAILILQYYSKVLGRNLLVDMKTRFFLFLIISAAALGFGQTNFAKGEELFMQNKPAEAAVYLENSIVEDPAKVEAFLYLGIAYEQMGRTDEAIAVYQQILSRAGALTANVTTNLGNAYFKKGSFAEAETVYTQAMKADIMYALAYLGRANARMQRTALMEAVSDYEQYLLLDPQTPQRRSIELLIFRIKSAYAEVERKWIVAEEMAGLDELRKRLLDEISTSLQGASGANRSLYTDSDDAERKQMIAEEMARLEELRQRILDEVAASFQNAAGASNGFPSVIDEAERKRLVAEEVARLEAERRQRLLDEVSASLQGAAGASKGLSTGAEDIEGYEGEFELE